MQEEKNTLSLTAGLRAPGDFYDWSHQFLLAASSLKLYNHIVQGTPLLPEPTMPDIRKRKYTKTSAALAIAITEATSDEGSSSGTTTSLDGEALQEHPSGEWSSNDLTPGAQKSFQTDMSYYERRTRLYDQQTISVDKLTREIRRTVSPTFIMTCCQPTESLATWYANLQSACGMHQADEKEEALGRYRHLLQPSNWPKTAAQATIWITKWEDAMARGQHFGVGETKDSSSWSRDFFDATAKVLPGWRLAYKTANKVALKNGTLGFRELGNDFRSNLPSIKDDYQPKIGKGSFATTFNGKGPEEDKPSKPQRKRRAEQGDHKGEQGCPACGLRHQLKRCFYVFPDLAPTGFIPRPQIEDRVKRALEDTELQGKVRSLRQQRHEQPTTPA